MARCLREAFEKLHYPDGGGMTLNHPTGKLADYLPMLDFDPRVLGIEVWNQLTSGFGSSRGFYDDTPGPHLHFYELWDQILRTGRRCWGFFVKDHNTLGRGRNVLLVPKLDTLSPPTVKPPPCAPTGKERSSAAWQPWP